VESSERISIQQSSPQTQELKGVIQVKIALINQDQNLLQNVLENSVVRQRQCIVQQEDGFHFVIYH
jgi:hypothetical protein